MAYINLALGISRASYHVATMRGRLLGARMIELDASDLIELIHGLLSAEHITRRCSHHAALIYSRGL